MDSESKTNRLHQTGYGHLSIPLNGFTAQRGASESLQLLLQPFNSIEWIRGAPGLRAGSWASSLSIPLNGFTPIALNIHDKRLIKAFQFHWMDSIDISLTSLRDAIRGAFQFHWMDSGKDTARGSARRPCFQFHWMDSRRIYACWHGYDHVQSFNSIEWIPDTLLSINVATSSWLSIPLNGFGSCINCSERLMWLSIPLNGFCAYACC